MRCDSCEKQNCIRAEAAFDIVCEQSAFDIICKQRAAFDHTVIGCGSAYSSNIVICVFSDCCQPMNCLHSERVPLF